LNLPEDLRYKPEFMFPVAIIPGPKEPPLEQLNHYLRPIIEQINDGWSPGYHLSHTADSPDVGEDVDLALILSINDLPAARKVSGNAGVRANIFCTTCDCRGRATVYRTDFDNWTIRNASVMRQKAEEWRDAESVDCRTSIEQDYGIRWSELWRLPYWDPTKMLVVDGMHCILEGLVHYHCRYVLCLDAEEAKVDIQPAAFEYPWTQYSNNTLPTYQGFDDKSKRHIISIHKLLQSPLGGDSPRSLDVVQLQKKLFTKRKNALSFVAYDLGLLQGQKVLNNAGIYVRPTTKDHLITLLIEWRLKLPKAAENVRPKTCDMDTLQYIQHVIRETDTPSWVHSVPLNYGEAAAGIIKAGEWQILSTIHLPIALATLWGDEEFPHQSHFLQILDHSMALFEATTIFMRNTMTVSRATRYRTLIRQWVADLYDVHPHTTTHTKRTNVHVAFHIFDFLILFGPAMSWWTFPFERLIGVLQRINSNDMIGGMMEQTILKSYTKGANLRRWLRRPDCPEVVRQFKHLFDKAFSPHIHPDSEPRTDTGPIPVEVAHYRHNSVNYSRARTHVGNSLVLYYPTPRSTSPVAGSIQKITTSSQGVRVYVQRQALLPPGQNDPFSRYPHFPAKTYSAEMEQMTRLDVVPFSSVLTHVARY
ncbi:hypothetical protein CPC08DRAFT_616641, partial [Agrocybe pediades]